MKKLLPFIILAMFSGAIWIFINGDKKIPPSSLFCNQIIEKSLAEIYNSAEEPPKYIHPCLIYIGPDISYKFSFEPAPANAADIVLNVYTSQGGLVQTIPIVYSLSLNTINLHDDINFDGYKDLLVRVFGPRASQFTYYIYNPEKKIFEEDEILSDVFSPVFDQQNRTITVVPDIPNYYYENGEQKYYSQEEQTTVFEFKNGKYSERVSPASRRVE